MKYLIFLLIVVLLAGTTACSTKGGQSGTVSESQSERVPASPQSDGCAKPPGSVNWVDATYQLKEENTAVEPGMKLGWLKCEDGRFSISDTDGGPGVVTLYSAGNPKENAGIILFGKLGRVLYTKTVAGASEEPPKKSEPFALRVKGKTIALKDLESEAPIEEVLGKPVSQETKELTDGADTLTGSFIKTLRYEGLNIELFAPKTAGDQFWVMTMEVTGQGYETAQGIGLGDTAEDVKSAYPGIPIALDGRTDPDNCAYLLSDESQYHYLSFEVAKGVITAIRMYHLIP